MSALAKHGQHTCVIDGASVGVGAVFMDRDLNGAALVDVSSCFELRVEVVGESFAVNSGVGLRIGKTTKGKKAICLADTKGIREKPKLRPNRRKFSAVLDLK